MTQTTTEPRIIAIRLTEAEIEAVRRITKVDATAPGVVAIVRRAIEEDYGKSLRVNAPDMPARIQNDYRNPTPSQQ